MGMSSDGVLAFGYNLGGGETEWLIEEADEDGEWVPSWASTDGDDLVTDAEKVLLGSVGFTETDWSVDGYYRRKKAAEERLGVELDSYCSHDFPLWMLVAHKVTAYQGDAAEIRFDELEALRVEQGWDAKLRAALNALGITPKQEKPTWLLVSYWG